MQTVKLFHEQRLRFPRRIRKGLNKGELHWVQAEHSRILQVLHNPRYAGAFVYGRVVLFIGIPEARSTWSMLQRRIPALRRAS